VVIVIFMGTILGGLQRVLTIEGQTVAVMNHFILILHLITAVPLTFKAAASD
jgi:hypothetical protein